jgi:hypothetical protein
MTVQPRVEIRRDFFLRLFERIKSLFPEIYGDALFDEDDATWLAHLYFLLSDCYKDWRVEEGHYTNDYKKAGLTIVAIMTMRPIRHPSTTGQDDLRPYYANQVFAICCATAILNKPISSMPAEDRDQFYAYLDGLHFQTAEPFLHMAAAGEQIPTGYRLNLTYREISDIDIVVLKVKDFCRMHDLEQKIYDLTHDP